MTIMKTLKQTSSILAIAALLTIPLASKAEEQKNKEKTSTYPLTTCVVSGEKLGEMGKPYVFNYEGREVQFCCKGCVKDFKKDPAKYLKKLDDAEKAAKK
jgi:YHS domain-containing protein